MAYFRPRTSTVSIFVLLSLAACSGGSESGTPAEEPAPARTFGPEERRIAGALSIGENYVSSSGSPQDQALLCDVALESLSDQLSGSRILTVDQQRVLDQARAFYRRRGEVDRSPAETVEARRTLTETHPERGERARLAIGCLRDLVRD